MEKECIYMYFTKTGSKLYTPNLELARVRAKAHGTEVVYEIAE